MGPMARTWASLALLAALAGAGGVVRAQEACKGLSESDLQGDLVALGPGCKELAGWEHSGLDRRSLAFIGTDARAQLLLSGGLQIVALGPPPGASGAHAQGSCSLRGSGFLGSA